MTTASLPSESVSTPAKKLPRALAYYAAYVILGLSLSVFGPTLPGLANQTGSTVGQISTIFASNSLGIVIGSLLGGRMYDRRAGHPVLAVTLAGMAALLFILPLVPALWMLVGVVLLLGVGMGILDVGGNTLIVWLFGREVGPYMNALHLCFGVGGFLSPLLADRVAVSIGGIRWTYWILAGLVVPVILWVLRTPSPERGSGEEEGAGRINLRGYLPLIVMLMGFFFLHTGTELSFGGFVFSYAMAMHIGPATTARLLNSMFWGGMTIGRLVSIPLATRLRPQTMLLIDLVGALVSVGVMLLFPGWPPAAWIGTFGLGLSIASMFPSSLNFAGERMPITGQVTSFLLVGANAGSMVLPWIIGQVFETEGPQSLLVVLGIVMALALGLFWAMTRYAGRLRIGKKQDES